MDAFGMATNVNAATAFRKLTVSTGGKRWLATKREISLFKEFCEMAAGRL
jgi:hypothetical protein